MIVIKCNSEGVETLRYAAEPLPITVPNGIAVKAIFSFDVVTDYVTFARGDRLNEYFYRDRWYNVFALYDGDEDGKGERLKGWYCNVTRPTEITADTITWTDLALDLWITPQYDIQILDWDEFMPIEKTLNVGEKAAVLTALTTLHHLAHTQNLPR